MFGKDFVYRVIQPGAGLFRKCRDPQIANIVKYLRPDRADFYGVAGDRDIKWFILLTLDRNGDIRADFTAQFIDSFGQSHAENRLTIDSYDIIFWLEPGFRRWCVIDG